MTLKDDEQVEVADKEAMKKQVKQEDEGEEKWARRKGTELRMEKVRLGFPI